AARLGVDTKHAQAGFEDTWYYLWKEQRLPGNVDPFKNQLDNPEDRARLTRVFEQGLTKVIGYALPLRRITRGAGGSLAPCESAGEPPAPRAGWQSGRWLLRSPRLYLIPGDSPMGYRLPLDSLPWEAKGDRDEVIEEDPWADRKPLPTKAQMLQRYYGKLRARSFSDNGVVDDQSVIRTALCVEPRGGRLYIFMPPQRSAEDYIELVAAIEATAKALHMPVM